MRISDWSSDVCSSDLPGNPNPGVPTMYEQINNQFAQFANFGAFGKQFAEATLKANALAFDNVEKTINLQIKTLEERLNATVTFVGEAAEAQAAETFQTLLPRGPLGRGWLGEKGGQAGE